VRDDRRARVAQLLRHPRADVGGVILRVGLVLVHHECCRLGDAINAALTLHALYHHVDRMAGRLVENSRQRAHGAFLLLGLRLLEAVHLTDRVQHLGALLTFGNA